MIRPSSKWFPQRSSSSQSRRVFGAPVADCLDQNTPPGKTYKQPSTSHVITASILFGMITAGAMFFPRPSNEALAADPQSLNRYDTISRGVAPSYSLTKGVADIDSNGSFSRAGTKIDPQQNTEHPAPSRIYLSPDQLSRMGRVKLGSNSLGGLALDSTPTLRTTLGDRFVDRTEGGNFVFYTIDPELQAHVEKLVGSARANHTAIVAMNPRTGAVLAVAGKSPSIRNVEYHAGFPAASLFKVVTAAAAVEQAGIQPDSAIPYRGGTYTLNESNYLPNSRLDRNIMTVAEALGRSCNPVFGQLGIRFLNGTSLSRYARHFGFNKNLGFEVPMRHSSASIPSEDRYELSRTSAGFGDVYISPIHAAALMSGIANGGLLPKPRVVEKVVSPDGATLHRGQPEALQRIVASSTASTLMEMMEYTTTVGTSRKEFLAASTKPKLGGIRVAAKTGTLKGNNPVGLNNWFIAAAPLENPQLALAVITVDAGYASKASHLGRRVFEKYFNIESVPDAPSHSVKKKLVKSTSKKSVKKSAARTVYAKKLSKSKVIVARATSKKKK